MSSAFLFTCTSMHSNKANISFELIECRPYYERYVNRCDITDHRRTVEANVSLAISTERGRLP